MKEKKAYAKGFLKKKEDRKLLLLEKTPLICRKFELNSVQKTLAIIRRKIIADGE